jgi:ketosteroid isomerase-like protein
MNALDHVLFRNATFYEALEQKDIAAMDAIWSHEDYARCVHPGWNLVRGWSAIRQSWENIFTGETKLKFSLRNVEAHVIGSSAVVVLLEEITFVNGVHSHTQVVVATNIFEEKNSTWKLVHHHASPILNVDTTRAQQESDPYRYRQN